MMYEARIQNRSGEVMLLTGREAVYQIIGINGLNPPSAQINLSNVVGLDGAKYNSGKLNTRNLVLTIKINGDVEQNRQELYRFFPTKQNVRFYYQNTRRNVYIDGFVDNLECDLFQQGQTAQISIICPQPYFVSLDEIISDISNTLAQFVFPFSINEGEPVPFSVYAMGAQATVYNGSEGDTGTIIQIDFDTEVSELMIRNTLTGDEFELDYNFEDGDKVIINTNKGQKSVTLIRDGAETNIFSKIKKGSVFFQLAAGDNYFIYLADDGAANEFVFIKFIHSDMYRGV